MLSPSTVESSDGSVPLPRAPSCERALEIPMSTLIAIPVRSMCVLWKEMSARQDTAARGQTLSVRAQAAQLLGVSLLSRPPIPMWLLSLICDAPTLSLWLRTDESAGTTRWTHRDPRKLDRVRIEEHILDAAERAIAELHPAAAVVSIGRRHMRAAGVDAVVPCQHIGRGGEGRWSEACGHSARFSPGATEPDERRLGPLTGLEADRVLTEQKTR